MKKLLNLIVFLYATGWQPCFAAAEAAFTAKKFGIAMIGVILSAVLIAVMLNIYKKLFHNSGANDKTTFDDKNLNKPETLDVAISNFLNKTKM